MSFYGPIDSDASTPVSVWVWLHNQFWMDVTDYCDITLSGRTIEIHGDGSHVLSAGYYAVLASASANGSDRLYCLGTLATNPPSVAPNSVDSGGSPVVQ